MKLFSNVDSIYWPVISGFGIVWERGTESFLISVSFASRMVVLQIKHLCKLKIQMLGKPDTQRAGDEFFPEAFATRISKKQKVYLYEQGESMPPYPSSGNAHPGRHLEQKYFKRQKMHLREKMVHNSVAHNPCKILRFACS